MGARALDMLAAVGLLRRSRDSFEAVGLRTGGAGPESVPFARASDAAVGAKSPAPGLALGGDIVLDGVFGREADGVFGRVLEGVLGREGVTEAREEGLDLDGAGLIGPDAFAEGWEAGVDMLGWKEEGGDFTGVRAVVFALAVLGLPSRVLDGVVGVRTEVVDGRPAVVPDFVAVVVFFEGDEGGSGDSTLATVTGDTGFSSTGSGITGSATGAGVGSDSGDGEVAGRTAGAEGSGDFALNSVLASNADATIGALGFGGHSRFSLNSSFAASPVCWDATLEERGGSPAADCLLFCCSKRPMRLATL